MPPKDVKNIWSNPRVKLSGLICKGTTAQNWGRGWFGRIMMNKHLVIFGFNRQPYFFFCRVASFKTCYKTMPGIKGLRVEIVSFVHFINCSFYWNQPFSCWSFGQFHPKNGVIVQEQNLFNSTGCTFLTLPYFETQRVKTLNFNQGFLWIRQKSKYLLFNSVFFFSFTKFNLDAHPK